MNQIKTLAARLGLPLLLALSLLLALLAGCGGQAPDSSADQPGQQTEEPASPSPEPTPTPEPEPDPVELALEQYRTIVGQADTYDYGSIDDPTGEYKYALVRIAPEDTVPALLLEQGTTFGVYHVLVFQYDVDGKTVLQAADTLMEGEATMGGFRGSLALMGDGNGIRALELSSGSGDMTISRVTLDGSALVQETAWEGRFDQMPDEMNSFVQIEWHDVLDASALGSWTPDAPQPAPAPAEPTEEPAVPVTDGDRIVFTGTLGAYSYSEVLALQGLDDPNPGSDQGETYWLIVLDAPQNMTLRSYGGNGYEGQVSIVNVTGAGGLEQYDGQRLTVSIDANSTWWPSDTSLPVGQPSTDDIHILQ